LQRRASLENVCCPPSAIYCVVLARKQSWETVLLTHPFFSVRDFVADPAVAPFPLVVMGHGRFRLPIPIPWPSVGLIFFPDRPSGLPVFIKSLVLVRLVPISGSHSAFFWNGQRDFCQPFLRISAVVFGATPKVNEVRLCRPFPRPHSWGDLRRHPVFEDVDWTLNFCPVDPPCPHERGRSRRPFLMDAYCVPLSGPHGIPETLPSFPPILRKSNPPVAPTPLMQFSCPSIRIQTLNMYDPCFR